VRCISFLTQIACRSAGAPASRLRAAVLFALCSIWGLGIAGEADARGGSAERGERWRRPEFHRFFHTRDHQGRRCEHGQSHWRYREVWRDRRVEQWCRTQARPESSRRDRNLRRSAPRPNIVVVLTDDQRSDTLEYMPAVMDRMVDEGVTFNNGFVPTAVCGPSRASVLTGQYAHNSGVLYNSVSTFEGRSTLATLLQDAGYTTSMIGKYMNYYLVIQPEVPAGWDDWHVFFWGDYYNHTLVENGEVVEFGSEPEEYSTDILRDRALDFIDENHERPFFLMLAPWAPHLTAVGAPRHVGAYATLPPWRPESYQEEDLSDKPRFVRWIRHLRFQGGIDGLLEHIEARDASHIRELETLLSVDEAVESIIERLERYHIDRDTIIVFTSDNGLHWGEHWLGGKYNAYEESIRVPMIVRYPRMIEHARADERLVLNIDIAPTLAELAGVELVDPMDGRSLSGILCDNDTEWRDDFLLEYFTVFATALDGMPPYAGVRNERWKYLIYASGFEELYDLQNDPSELDNLLKTEPDDSAHRALADALFERTIELKTQ